MIVEHNHRYNTASVWRQDNVYSLYIIILKFYDESSRYCVVVLYTVLIEWHKTYINTEEIPKESKTFCSCLSRDSPGN